MIIDITGFGWSGSGAVLDLLSEYDNVIKLDNTMEFSILHIVDGIMDLEYKLSYKHCRFLDSDIAIKRFLHLVSHYYNKNKRLKGKIKPICENYISQLEGIEYNSRSFYDLIYLNDKRTSYIGLYNAILSKLFNNQLLRSIGGKQIYNILKLYNISKKYLSYTPNNFLHETRALMSQILELFRNGQKGVLLTDHMFSPDNPNVFFKYIEEDTKCIIVRRDPRDTYILAKEIYKGKIPVPVDNVDDFIWFYKKTIEETKVPDSDKILSVQFEDLIYRYEETVNKIEIFTGIRHHVRRKTLFNPSVSVNNTQLFSKYKKYDTDIRKIEEKLPLSLFHFENYSHIETVSNVIF